MLTLTDESIWLALHSSQWGKYGHPTISATLAFLINIYRNWTFSSFWTELWNCLKLLMSKLFRHAEKCFIVNYQAFSWQKDTRNLLGWMILVITYSKFVNYWSFVNICLRFCVWYVCALVSSLLLYFSCLIVYHIWWIKMNMETAQLFVFSYRSWAKSPLKVIDGF